MRRRHEQSMPFGVFVALALLGAIGGLVTGLSARSMRTASVLSIPFSTKDGLKPRSERLRYGLRAMLARSGEHEPLLRG
jgi:hypothetical protein